MTVPGSLADVAGLTWADCGQATLVGSLLDLADRLDRRFVALAQRWQAAELRFPPCIAAADLERIDYFRSFPHLATFAVCLDADEDNLGRFAGGEPVSAGGQVALTEVAPVEAVLTPAACYHLYAHHQGRHFDDAGYFTTRATCFRRESYYRPLERQWSFTMREIVCLGNAEETQTFLDEATDDVDALAVELDLPLSWAEASDPFFRPSRNPQYLMQQVDPTKHELLFDDRLAIASTNLHHDHFGRAFDISRTSGTGGAVQPAHSACVAFGIERWLAAVVRCHGADSAGWPEVGP
jgi:hypothetical protein